MAIPITVSQSNSPQSAKPLFDVSVMLPRSYLADTRLKNERDIIRENGQSRGGICDLGVKRPVFG